jgi:formyltetrahydrofolate-dependent phosphoribosylglycinamide formyltransferase
MKILIVGSGAREHALVETIVRSTENNRPAPELFCIGSHRNPGIETICGTTVLVADITSPDRVLEAARTVPVDLVIIGPEAPLAAGVVDVLEDAGFSVVGPRQSPARIETSKSFCRELLQEFCPEATPAFFVVTSMAEARAALRELGDGWVVKADGLCGGKGVKVAGEHLSSHEEALEYCREMLEAAPRLVIEEKLIGEEFSLLSFTDGEECLHMPPAQDHKRARDGDRGPNTGGMGSYTDAHASLPFLGRQDVVAAQHLNERVVLGIREKTGIRYRGIIYGGFMATAHGISIVEYNARLGDPEALNILPLLETDLLKICSAVVSGEIGSMDVHFRSAATVCKYLVPPGYPENGEKGVPLDLSFDPPRAALREALREESPAKPLAPSAYLSFDPPVGVPLDLPRDSPLAAPVALYIGSMVQKNNRLETAGARAVAVTGFGATIEEAERACESRLEVIGSRLFHRRDIGTQQLIRKRTDHMNALRNHPLRVGILGSTRGTSTQKLIEAAEAFQVPASVEVVLSDREEAFILERAAAQGIPFHHVNPLDGQGKKKPREIMDIEMIALLARYRVDLVLCVGFMRVLSRAFCERYEERAINVHPSLLPEFAGGMDMDVHREVINAGKRESGCTVHYLVPAVDTGRILLQKRCPVHPDDTPETLRRRVQDLEGDALVEAVTLHHARRGRA